jgi:hypothetical protein
MMIDIEEVELLRQQYVELFKELLRDLKGLRAEVREMNAMRSMSEPTQIDENELARERAIAFAKAKQRDEDERIS